ncbi:MAG: tyrosine-type recombinase/integrase [Lachnospiraceae bacterium]|nr:tyrosine-type recombinase/integrase [Lachnospiraceae bacterium]
MAEIYLESFMQYLSDEKGLKNASVQAGKKEAERFGEYLDNEGIRNISDLLPSSYHHYLEKEAAVMSSAAFNRLKSCMRSYFRFLSSRRLISYYDSFVEETDAFMKDEARSQQEDAQKAAEKGADILDYAELRALFEAPDDESYTGIRDRAMLELIYSAALRAEEVLSLRVSDLDLQLNICFLRHSPFEREMAPFGSRARRALEAYLTMMKGFFTARDDVLFLNQNGKPMSRQGLWKMVSKHGKNAGIERPVSVSMLRDSFAAHLMENGADAAQTAYALGLKGSSFASRLGVEQGGRKGTGLDKSIRKARELEN